MLQFSSLISNQIRFLVESVNDANCDSIYRELRQFVEFGGEASILLLQTCLGQVNYHDRDIQNLQVKRDLLSAIFKYVLEVPNFCSIFSEALGATLMSEGFLEDISNMLNLSAAEKIGVGLALSESEMLDFRTKGQNFSIAQIKELCANPTAAISNKQIQDVVLFLYRSEGLSKHVDSFTEILSLLPLKTSALFVQTPILSDDIGAFNSLRKMDLFFEFSDNDFGSVLAEIEKEMSMADIMRELGYKCTVNISHCKEMLSLFLPLNEATLSKLLGIIARTQIGLDDSQNIHSAFCSALDCSSSCKSPLLRSWNVDVLVDAIMQLAPTTNWISVMEKLDHEGFNIPDETSFSVLMSIYTKACKDPFPLHVICGFVWKNTEGQLSFLRQAVSAPPDVFTFVHCSRQLVHSGSTNLSKGNGNRAWSCLDLLNVLCQLAESGHINSVRLMLEHPLNRCPEVLLFGIAHINTPYNLIQYEVSSTVFPAILRNPTKSGVIHRLWRVNPHMVLRGFVDASTDPNNLFIIVDICQDMKILSSTLEVIPFPVSIRLAALAYSKEHLILEKWLSVNTTVYKDPFFEDCLKYLKEILSDVEKDVPDSSSLQQSRAAILNIYRKTCSVFFKVLQAYPGELRSHQSFKELKRLHFLSSSRKQSPVSPNMSASNGRPVDLEEESNAYFHHLFSGQLTVDAMVRRLACFKESSEYREQVIFDCMIANIFEEYKFFPNYPDRQLILAAVLFGLLIKHQLLTHPQLSVALRGVLDALCKSVDSKMFVFGTKALEQFIDRLGEWPQYCNHILQISNLRGGTHAGLVSAVENALAVSSPSPAETNAVNNIPSEQQLSSSAPSSSENMEVSTASWQLVSSTSSPLGQQLSSFQLQHKHPIFLADQLKPSATSVNNTEPLQSHARCLVPTTVDSVINLKTTASPSLQAPPQHSAIVPAVASSSSHFLCPPFSTVPAGLLRKPSYGTGFGAALNIETLVAAAEGKDTLTETPASEVQDKILFMINNLSTANIDAKAVELTEVLKEQYYPWFAQYMVMKRASIKPNFHDLNLKFLEKVNSRLLNNEIIKATYENCKVLLRSDLIKSSSEERSLLKNLGSWLGKFTIGRNQALRAKEIDPKVLIIEAYEKGLMIAVIPFTSKILEPCHSSLAYKPPNPWTVGILRLLVEIYNLPNLKMNLKFDIEVLFKNLRLDIKGVRPTSLLKDRVREVEGNPDFSNKDTGISQAHGMFEVNSSIAPTADHAELQAEYTASSHISLNSVVEDDKIGAITGPEHVHSTQGLTQVTPSDSSFSLSQLLQSVPNWDPHMNVSSVGSLVQFDSIVQTSMEKAIREIAPHVTQRSISVASQTTKDLVLKDYAMETDVTMIIRAARLMVGNLAGNLAYVTCSEPLRVALANQIRSLLQTLKFDSESMEQRVQFLTIDNLCHGCEAIKSIASEKAMEMIDEQIALAFTSINKRREVVGSAYFDIETYAYGPLARVPEVLRPRPGLISIPQKQVYDDFARDIWQNTCGNSSSVLSAGPPGLDDCLAVPSLPPICVSNSIHQNSDIVLASQVAPGITSTQPFDLIQEETDGSAQFSFSTTHVGPNDRVLQPVAGTKSIASLHASVMPHQLNMAEASRLTKDVGAAVPVSPLFPSTGTALSESSLHAGGMGNCKLLAEEISSMFAEWCRTCDLPATSGTAYTRFISQLQQRGFLKGDDITDWFLRSFMELSVAHYHALEQVQTSDSLPFQSSEFHQLLFRSIDAYAMLVGLVLKHTLVDQGSSILLPKVLQVTISVIHKDAEKKKTFFNPRPYFRLFVNWFLDLVTPDTILDTANFKVLTSFANALQALQPVKVPSFSFAWLDLVSHRNFMPKLLTINHPYAWTLFERLLVDLFKFMGPYLKNAGQRQPIQVLYKGTLRMLLILLHDFPEFLCSFHFSFCDLIPHNCIQMRNVILSASPRNIKIPDPQSPNLKIDLLPEMSLAPCILSDIDGALKAKQLKTDIDEYIKTRPEGSAFLADLQQTLMVPQNEESLLGTRYDVPLINSVVFYVAMQGIPQLQRKRTVQPASTQQVIHTPMDIFLCGAALDIFQSLIKNLDEEGRYFFLNAVANQLRFPNSHTHYFSYLLLYLFETNEETIQEQITRVLLERRIADRPHPWGLLTTFIELVKNPKYDFWNRSFTQHEVKLLLEKVSMMPPKDSSN